MAQGLNPASILHADKLNLSPYMTSRERAQLRANLYALAHDLIGGILLAGLTVGLAFLFSVK